MKNFVKNIVLFSIPIFLIIASIVYLDFFRVFRSYDDYYTNNFIGLNRESVCFKTYNKYRTQEQFNSFIFGNSGSQAFKCYQWKKYIGPNGRPFHFDAAVEGLYGISNKIKYIDQLGDSIKNALITIDISVLGCTANKDGHLFISPPALSDESIVDYYLTFLRASLNLKFLMIYIDYSIFKTYKDYMGTFINISKHSRNSNKINCDLDYGYDQDIIEDSLGYYTDLVNRGVFYDRTNKTIGTVNITKKEISQLELIKNIFDQHQTNFKIIIPPAYDQVPIQKDQLNLVKNIFGEKNIYDFSGKNELTEPLSNYYENDHYRPHVANEILERIYEKP